ncbi:hypothetical protein KC867_01320 [Candidatus Saccharibacteria bacterium]|nr:hypothetical protein [Candidatus Saccharibacteria bacterium]
MLKEFVLFIKYPYTAGTIGLIWLGSAALLAIDKNLPLIGIVIINMVASVIIATFGFKGKGEV